MKVLAVTSKSLLDTKWINLSIRVFSPREFLSGIFGIVCLIAAITGKTHPIIAFFGITVLIFGFIPFGFLPPEKQLLSFLSFHMKKDNGTKKSKKEESDLTGIGRFLPEGVAEEEQIKTEAVEIAFVEDLDVPYTLKLKTAAEKQFIPVSIFFSEHSEEIHVASTVTDRHGNVTCTILLENYGQKRIRVIGDEDSAVFYDKMVEFQRK